MDKAANHDPDAIFARKLIIEHIRRSADWRARCDVSTQDPPDLVVTWEGGERWGVEVTRAYQHVERIGDKRIVSQDDLNHYFERFGRKLEVKTRNPRHYSYVLYFEGPGLFQSTKENISIRAWERCTMKAILDHINSGSREVLRFRYGNLRTKERGSCWTIMYGTPPVEIRMTIDSILDEALSSKAKDLKRWDQAFSQRWLLILNCYPLIESAADVQLALRRLKQKGIDFAEFDGIFWSGYPDRTLVRVLLR